MSHAERLVTRDEEDITRSNEFGQNVQDTFHRADVFLDTDDQQTLREQVDRFIALVFGDPHLTPYPDEYGMFLAQAAGFRSGDTSRQVGASVVSPTRDVLSLGTNDAPKAKGDLYWPDDPYDARDIVLRTDSSVEVKEAIVRELLEKLSSGHQLSKRASDLVRSNLEEAAKHRHGCWPRRLAG